MRNCTLFFIFAVFFSYLLLCYNRRKIYAIKIVLNYIYVKECSLKKWSQTPKSAQLKMCTRSLLGSKCAPGHFWEVNVHQVTSGKLMCTRSLLGSKCAPGHFWEVNVHQVTSGK
ncbi:unnamed protein product [Candidula unifasciata]|uniref:Uncharacterized protein n=1 Tax=Candidula unifasciata TaxID=100452 RepID=A0A8S4A780_9EUPU|nr:unnamed protein product [Candidula unifasciata]